MGRNSWCSRNMRRWNSRGSPAATSRATCTASIEALQYHIGDYEAAYAELAKRFGVFILAGSAPTRLTDGRFVNRAQFFSPNGHTGFQQKHIMTRFEAEEWGISASAGLCIFDIGSRKSASQSATMRSFP